jgi:hypothetical protein
MAKKYLDYEGLDYYDGLLKEYITEQLNDGLSDALATLAGALQVKGTISGTVTMKTAYTNAKVGDTYFAKGAATVTFVDTSGKTVTETLEDSDAIVCIVSQAATSSSNAAIQWATLNTNWAVENKNPTISFGSTPSTAIVGNVGGMNLTVQLPNSSTIVSGIASELRKEFVSGQKDNSFDETEQGNARENLGLGGVATMNTTATIGNPSGNLIPTDLAVKNFVESKIGQSTSGVSDVQRFDNTTGQWLGHSVVNGGIARLPKIKMDSNGNLTEYYPDMLATSGSSVIGSSVLFSTITGSEIDSLF